MMKLRLLIASFFMIGQIQAQYIPRFEIQGHRGARGLFPENTIPGFLKALDLGVTTVELDVVITKDKRVILSHEPWMAALICNKPSGDSVKVAEQKKFNIYKMTYDEVQQFDCGSRGNRFFPQQVAQPATKPLLSEVIIAIEEHIRNYTQYEVDYNIEIKSLPATEKTYHPSVQEYSDLVYQLVDQYLPLERVVIQSFDFRVLQYWHKKYPDVRLSALVENLNSIDVNLNALGFKPSIYSPDFRLLTREKVVYLHSKKIRVIPWGVNEEGDMLAYKGMGVDGFITDYPDRARKYKMTLNIQPK
jgi:glycerophosphoryl diester phosphodiesterase